MAVIVIAVYARCSSQERLELWDEIKYTGENINGPWIVGGDFNVILHKDEKLGGLPFNIDEASDFQHCFNNSALEEVQTNESRFTWWNGRVEDDCIFKRLDRVLLNHDFLDILPSSKMSHLIRQGSDHTLCFYNVTRKRRLLLNPLSS